MIFDDDQEPVRSQQKRQDLEGLSIHELNDRIAALQDEIEAIRAMIAKKESHRAGIDGLFSRGDVD